jgi:protein-L-isoaspartate(D-aspartate) O-methyltransferase
MTEDPTRLARERMVRDQIAARGVRAEPVLEAMRAVPRHRFVPDDLRREAYHDHPLAIGYGQTISQPYIVAFMTEELGVRPGHRVLEVGTGCGYQTAVLAALGAEVYTIEVVPQLSARARDLLDELGVGGVHYRVGDGGAGWPEEAPFDRVLVAAAAPDVPRPLLDQLADGGRIVIPVGDAFQDLVAVQRAGADLRTRTLCAVRFVPLVGRYGEGPPG